MTDLSAEKLAELREIAGKATQSDWWVGYESSDQAPFEQYAHSINGPTDEGVLLSSWLSDDYRARYGHQITDVPGIADADAEHIAAFDPPTVIQLLDLIAEQDAELAQVEAFINQRPEYVTALKNTRGGDSTEDYYRWSGHAEARRQLATSLNLTTPYEPGEKATRYEVTDGD